MLKEPSLDVINDRSFNFIHKKQKMNIINNYIEDPNNPLNTNALYGTIPIYIDPKNRSEIITKASKLVEIYEIVFDFLLKYDKTFKIKNDEYEMNLKEDNLKKPFSILQADRNILDEVERISSLSANSFHKNYNDVNKNKNNINNLLNKITTDHNNPSKKTKEFLNFETSENINQFKKDKFNNKEESKLFDQIFKKQSNIDIKDVGKDIKLIDGIKTNIKISDYNLDEENVFKKKFEKQSNINNNFNIGNIKEFKKSDAENNLKNKYDERITNKIDSIINNLIESNTKTSNKINKTNNNEKFLNQLKKKYEEKQNDIDDYPFNFKQKIDNNNEEKIFKEENVNLVKIEKSINNKNINVLDVKNFLNKVNNRFLSVTQHLIISEKAKLKAKKEEEEKLKLLKEEELNKMNLLTIFNSKRANIEYVDSDGDVIINSEDGLSNCFSDASKMKSYIKRKSLVDNFKNNINKFPLKEITNIRSNSFNYIENDQSKGNNLKADVNKFEKNEFNFFKKDDYKTNKNDNYQENKIDNFSFNTKKTLDKEFDDVLPVIKLLNEPEDQIYYNLINSSIKHSDISDTITFIEMQTKNNLISNETKEFYIDKLSYLIELLDTIDKNKYKNFNDNKNEKKIETNEGGLNEVSKKDHIKETKPKNEILPKEKNNEEIKKNDNPADLFIFSPKENKINHKISFKESINLKDNPFENDFGKRFIETNNLNNSIEILKKKKANECKSSNVIDINKQFVNYDQDYNNYDNLHKNYNNLNKPNFNNFNNLKDFSHKEYVEKNPFLPNKKQINNKNKIDKELNIREEIDLLNKIEDENNKYILDKSVQRKDIIEELSDIDKLLSDIDKKDVNMNIFGKKIYNNDLNKYKFDKNNKKNYNQIDNKQEKNLDLFQILGDCTNKIKEKNNIDIRLGFKKKYPIDS